MARPQLLLLLAVLLAVVAFASADSPAPAPKANHDTPSLTDPVAHSPVTDYVDVDDDTDEDDDAAPAGSPLGTTMRPPEKVSDTPSSSTSIMAPGAGASSLAAVAVIAASLASSLVF